MEENKNLIQQVNTVNLELFDDKQDEGNFKQELVSFLAQAGQKVDLQPAELVATLYPYYKKGLSLLPADGDMYLVPFGKTLTVIKTVQGALSEANTKLSAKNAGFYITTGTPYLLPDDCVVANKFGLQVDEAKFSNFLTTEANTYAYELDNLNKMKQGRYIYVSFQLITLYSSKVLSVVEKVFLKADLLMHKNKYSNSKDSSIWKKNEFEMLVKTAQKKLLRELNNHVKARSGVNINLDVDEDAEINAQQFYTQDNGVVVEHAEGVDLMANLPAETPVETPTVKHTKPVGEEF